MGDEAAVRCVACRGGPLERVRAYRTLQQTDPFVGLTVARCRGCGLEAAEPMPSEADLDRYYASGAYDRGNPELAGQSSWWERLPGRAESQRRFVVGRGAPPASWLDLGAGYGFLLDAARAGGTGRTAAVEATPSRAEQLARRGHELHPDLGAVPAGEFDLVSMSHLLEHVARPTEYLEAAARALSPSGRLFCEVPNQAVWPGSHDDPHVLFFDLASLASTLRSAGLEVEQIATAGVVVTRPRLVRGIEARVWAGIRRLRPPDRLATLQPEFRSTRAGKRLVIRALARPVDAAG